MFKVIEKKAWEEEEVWLEFTVYAIRDDVCGYPQFLIYDSAWKWESAKNFIPVEDKE